MTEWFPRLADAAPYMPPLAINRSTLAHAAVRPELHISSMDGHTFLTWPYADHTATSQSPAAEHGWRMQHLIDPDEILQRCVEATELPGTPRDYHHVLHMGYEHLYPWWKQHGAYATALETLCTTDIALIERTPEIINLGTVYARVDAHQILIDLYTATERHHLIEDIRTRARHAHQRI
jgi:hypothetical protein